MRWILIIALFISLPAAAQLKDYIIGVKGDTLNRIDMQGRKQGPWVHRYETIRGERGFEEEGEYTDDRKEGIWRKYSLMGDLTAIENYRWGFLDGKSQYFNTAGMVFREESWRAFNPDKLYDTIDVEDVLLPGSFQQVIVKNEGASVKHGTWNYFDPGSGLIVKTETFTLGKIEKNNNPASLGSDTLSMSTKKVAKPKEVLEFEKKNAGKKKVKVRDGSVGY
jgi:antitoxin component YwqK of YwqJK toxin-antitoxin module